MLVSQLNSTIIDFFRSLNQKKRITLLLAVSGGSDSVALAYVLHELSQSINVKRIALVHVNHGLRGEESDGDELFVRDLANSLGLEFFTKRLSNLNLNSPSLEEVARKERYSFFLELKETHGFDYIVTAHTADDQAETVLYRLIRGSGINGLRAIHAVRDDGVLRPFLSLKKSVLIEWLESKGHTFRVDSSNKDLHFRRNFLRHKVIPPILEMDPSAIEKIAAFAEDAAQVFDVVQKIVRSWIAENCNYEDKSSFIIKKSGFTNNAVASEAIHQILRENGIATSKRNISLLLLDIDHTSGRFLLPGGWSYYPLRETVLFCKDSVLKENFSYELKNPGITEIIDRKIRITITESVLENLERTPNCAILDKEKCSDKLLFRKIRSDDYFVPLGRTGKTNALTFLSKQGFTKIQRERMGVVVDSNNKILWIPGIRINDSCRITKDTKRILKISFHSLCSIV